MVVEGILKSEIFASKELERTKLEESHSSSGQNITGTFIGC
jgi:hypothetical protein